jgi:hypothetical protein
VGSSRTRAEARRTRGQWVRGGTDSAAGSRRSWAVAPPVRGVKARRTQAEALRYAGSLGWRHAGLAWAEAGVLTVAETVAFVDAAVALPDTEEADASA